MQLKFISILLFISCSLSAMQPTQWIRNTQNTLQEELKAEDAARATQELAHLAGQFPQQPTNKKKEEIISETKALLQAGANPNVISQNQWNPDYILPSAVRYYPELIEPLLQAGANPNLNQVRPVIFEAFVYRRIPIIKLLLEHNANPDTRAPDRPYRTLFMDRTLLMEATRNNLPQVMQLLLSYGANPNLFDDNGSNALIEAIINTNLNNVNLLLQAGADPYVSQPGSFYGSAFDYTKRMQPYLPSEEQRKRYQDIIDLFEHPETIRRTGLEKLP